MSLGARGASVCSLLDEKTSDARKWGPLDQFLFDKASEPPALRLPSWSKRFEQLTAWTLERLRSNGAT